MNDITQQSLSGIVLEHHEAIPVFEKYNLDFCCGGKKTLEAACKEKNLSLQDVLVEIESCARPGLSGARFEGMDAEQLIGYILLHHHFYVRQALPTISEHIGKVVAKHGDTFPYMCEVQRLFAEVQAELLPHMMKEEQILFPRIREISELRRQHRSVGQPLSYIEAPVAVMESEHERAGDLMFAIRELTGHYIPPETACTTHRLCLEELKAFEEDLHQHVHLENNVLFPMGEKLMSVS